MQPVGDEMKQVEVILKNIQDNFRDNLRESFEQI